MKPLPSPPKTTLDKQNISELRIISKAINANLSVDTTARGGTRFSLCVPVCVTKEGVKHVQEDVKEGSKPVGSENTIRPVSDEVEVEGGAGPNFLSQANKNYH